MAEDVTGPDGPPRVNFYSIDKNSLLVGELIPTGGNGNSSTNSNTGSSGFLSEGIDVGTIENFDDLVSNYINKNYPALNDMGYIAQGLMESADTSNINPLGYILQKNNEESEIQFDAIDVDNFTLDEILTLISVIKPFLNEDQQKKVEEIENVFKELNSEEVQQLIALVSDFELFIKEMAKQKADEYIVQLKGKLNTPINNAKFKVAANINLKRDQLKGVLFKTTDDVIDQSAKAAIEFA
jgi:hypothetical protein